VLHHTPAAGGIVCLYARQQLRVGLQIPERLPRSAAQPALPRARFFVIYVLTRQLSGQWQISTSTRPRRQHNTTATSTTTTTILLLLLLLMLLQILLRAKMLYSSRTIRQTSTAQQNHSNSARRQFIHPSSQCTCIYTYAYSYFMWSLPIRFPTTFLHAIHNSPASYKLWWNVLAIFSEQSKHRTPHYEHSEAAVTFSLCSIQTFSSGTCSITGFEVLTKTAQISYMYNSKQN